MKDEKLNEEASRNNNLHSSTLKNDVDVSKESQNNRVEKKINEKRITRS